MECYYMNSKGESVYLDRAPYYMTQDTDLFNFSWAYRKNSIIDNFAKELEERTLQIAIIGNDKQDCYNKMNEFLDATDIDVLSNVHGTLYVDDWYINCYFVANEKDYKYISNNHAVIKVRLIPEGANWTKETLHKFRYTDQNRDMSGKGYPYGYPYDYGQRTGYTGKLENEHFTESDFVLIIYGYAENPIITIGSNTYHLDYTIQEGERVIIISRDRTITLIYEESDLRENLYRYRDRKHNIFQKIPSGTWNVSCNGNYDYDIWLCTERSEPEWK